MTAAARRKLVAGNWKMQTTRARAIELAGTIAEGVVHRRQSVRTAAGSPAQGASGDSSTQGDSGRGDSVEVVVCPPFPYLLPVAEAIRGSGVELGAQNVSAEPPGALTGEVAVPMLVDCGCRYVIIGHSERRHILGEQDDVLCRKVKSAIAGGLRVIFCVGETLAEREAGKTQAVVDRQMETGLAGIDESSLEHLTLAYEPVWAIGTGRTATPAQAQEVHLQLRNWLRNRYNSERGERLRILYGGSVKADNARDLMSQADVDGALVGGASLEADAFLAIIDAAANKP